jgi:hypothetical protein
VAAELRRGQGSSLNLIFYMKELINKHWFVGIPAISSKISQKRIPKEKNSSQQQQNDSSAVRRDL